MSTENPFTTASTSTASDSSAPKPGMSLWKIVAIVVAILVVLALVGPILKAAFWIGVVALAVFGAYTLYKAKS